jgi:integrase
MFPVIAPWCFPGATLRTLYAEKIVGTRLTKRSVDGLLARGAEYVAWDSEIAGFGVRVRSTGAKTYIVQYRAGAGRKAPTRKLTLGTVGKLTAEEARSLAKKAVGSVAHGADPAAQRAEDRKGVTVAELAAVFLSEHVSAKRRAGTAAHYRDVLDRIAIPALGRLKADRVSRADLAKLHLKWKSTPYQANRVLAVVGSMYGFGAKHGLVAEGMNPARGIERYSEDSRERFLSTDELVKLGAAIRKAERKGITWEVTEWKPTSKHIPKKKRRTVIGPHAAAAIRLLLFTGCRLREILHLRWEHVDFERGLLFLPNTKTGRKTIVLNVPALAVLKGLERIGSYVVASEQPDEPRADLKRPWAMVTREARLEGLRIHDLRHSFASFGAGGGLGLPIVGKLLGHASAVTTARYAHLDADPLRVASERIGSTIAAALGESVLRKAGAVVKLRGRSADRRPPL